MSESKQVTCSFSMDRDLYNQYKSIIVRKGKNVKGDLIRYMNEVVKNNVPNWETLQALEEVNRMKADASIGKTYHDVDEMITELLS